MSGYPVFIAPAAPLVLRSGKAFGTAGAAGGDAFPFPLPGTLAGALRGACGDAKRVDFRGPPEPVEKLKEIRVGGPLFAHRSPGESIEYLLPRPLDAAYLDVPDAPLARLVPGEFGPDEYADLPDEVAPLFLPPGAAERKSVDGPAFWNWERMMQWLSRPLDVQGLRTLHALGTGAPPTDVRTHVVIDAGTSHALEGGLFQSAGPDFGPRHSRRRGWEPGRYGVVATLSEALGPGYIKVGGDGRLSRVEPVSVAWPGIPQDVLDALRGRRRLRMLLATPALFDGGWKPGWLKDGGPPGLKDFQLVLKAAAVDRAQPVSGWDMTAGASGARPARRMAPAGSVYWLEIGPAWRDAAALAEEFWLKPVSDCDGDCNDGYGLAIFGTWD